MNKRMLFLSAIITLLLSNILYAQTSQDITLKPGFNFISFSKSIALTPTELKSQNTSIEDIYLFSPSAGSFLSHSEGTLTTLSSGKGYIIKTNSSTDVKLSINGNEITSAITVNLKAGFNLIGFSQTPSTYTFDKLMSENSIIKGCYKWFPVAGSFIQVIRNESGVITKLDGVDPTLKVGESYFINMYADATLNFDNANISLNPSSYSIPTPKIALPVLSPAGGSITSSQKINITCATEGTQIYYKINDDPSTLYNGSFTITSDCTIKVTASKVGWTNSDVLTATFTMVTNPELEISGALPSNAINSPRPNINFALSIGSKGNSISVVRTDSENTEIGTVTVSGSTYTANIPITDNTYTAQIIIKDSYGRILFRNILGKTLIKSEIPATTTKVKILNINIDATSTAMALLAKEKNISINKITTITATDLQNGIATKTSTVANEISQQFSATPNLITEISKAVSTVSSTILLTTVSTTTVPTAINSATELLSSFLKVIKEPTLQTTITQAQLPTSVTISTDQKIDASTTIIEPILKLINRSIK